MSSETLLTISSFARMTGIKRDNLRFYDRIGLLSPELRGENGYRYYTHRQLTDAFLIHTLRSVGVGLEDIRQHAEKPTSEAIYNLCLRHSEKIQEEFLQLQRTDQFVRCTLNMIREARAHNEHDFFLQELTQEPLFLCKPMPSHMTILEGSRFSYEDAVENGIDTRCLNGYMLVYEPLGPGAMTKTRFCYFKCDDLKNAYKPAGLYAVAYGLSPLTSDTLYLQLLDFIVKQNLRVCGNVYVEFPFSAYVPPENRDQYCLRIEIPVEKPMETQADAGL